MRHLKWIGAITLAALLLYKPEAAALGAAQAMARWYSSVAPAMLPFLMLMPLITCEEAAQAYELLLGGIMRKLFNLPGAAAPALVVGMVAGSPAGAVAARNAAARAGMSQGQLRRLAIAASGFSPAFLIGGVGTGMLGSATLGWRLYLTQGLTQLTMAALLRNAWSNQTQPVKGTIRAEEEQPVRESVLISLSVCGYMAVFGAICFALRASAGRAVADVLLCAMDVPSGAGVLSTLRLPMETRLVLLAGLCGYGGACVAAQNLSALKDCGMGAVGYVGMRILCAIISAGYMTLILRLRTVDAMSAGGVFEEKTLVVGALFASVLSIPAVIQLKNSSFNNLKIDPREDF